MNWVYLVKMKVMTLKGSNMREWKPTKTRKEKIDFILLLEDFAGRFVGFGESDVRQRQFQTRRIGGPRKGCAEK